MRNRIAAGLAVLLAIGLTACDRAGLMGAAEIRGTVLDIEGEPIPGVVVTLTEPYKQCLTDALGQYSTGAKPGRVELQFMKTGYTSGALVIEDAEAGAVVARPVSLWRLPQTTGLFLFEQYEYRRAAPLKPKTYVGEKGVVIYGIGKLTGIVQTRLPRPLLLCYNMPWYDAKLARLAITKAAAPESPSVKEDIWVSEQSVPLAMAPVDEPDRLLWEVRLMEPLEPGIYAFHWGALEGHTTTDERMFVFTVTDESGESALPPGEETQGEPAPDKGNDAGAEPADKPSHEPADAPEEAPADEAAADEAAADEAADEAPDEAPAKEEDADEPAVATEAAPGEAPAQEIQNGTQ